MPDRATSLRVQSCTELSRPFEMFRLPSLQRAKNTEDLLKYAKKQVMNGLLVVE
jgi:hypothetical protein